MADEKLMFIRHAGWRIIKGVEGYLFASGCFFLIVAAGQVRDNRKHRHEHGDNDEADAEAEDNDHNRLDSCCKRLQS